MQNNDCKPGFGAALPEVVILAGEVRTIRSRERAL
jgi:hypothetical protein